MKQFFLKSFLWLSLVTSLSAQNDSSAIEKFLASPEFKHASIGLCIKGMNGNTLYAYNQDKLLTPASTMKVVTTATALEILGDDYRYKTKLSFSEDDSTVVVTGAGDPTLGSEYAEDKAQNFLEKWLSEIKDQHFSKRPFHLLIDDSLFGYQGISYHWTWEDMGNYYACGSYGISYKDNTYKIYFSSLNADSTPVILHLEPNIPDLCFQNDLQTNNADEDNGYIHGAPFSNNRSISGDIPVGKSSFSIKGDIPDPGLFLAKTLTDAMRIDGMTVTDYATTRLASKKERKLKKFYEHESPEMKDIVRQVNVRSNNHYAEHLIRTIGANGESENCSDALQKGISKVQSYWKSKGLDTTSLLQYDGCGLSPQDGVTPEFMTNLLLEMQRGKNHKSFYESLPKAGEEGTLRNFLKESRLVGKIRAKSGSISGVQCFAGYFMDGDRKYAFSVMVNKFEGTHRQTVKEIEKLLLSVF